MVQAQRLAAENARLDELRMAVLAHARAEERYDFAHLRDKSDQSTLLAMAASVNTAEALAPTHPHAGVESATANLAAGPLAAIVDRVKDAVRGTSGESDDPRAYSPSFTPICLHVGAGDRRGALVDRLIVVAALTLVPLAAACGASAPTAGPERGVTISDLQRKEYFYQGDFLGKTVTVSATVADVLGPQVFELSGGNVGSQRLTVVTDRPVEVSKDEVVQVTGTVGQLHLSAPSEGVPYVQRELYATPETKPYLYHATVSGR